MFQMIQRSTAYVAIAILSTYASSTASAQISNKVELNQAVPQLDLHQHPAPGEPLVQQQMVPTWQPPQRHHHGPKLGITAVGTGQSIEVYSVSYGTAASRLGLERGDRLLTINGHPVRSIQELRQVLKDAVRHHHGQVTVLIDNVRARYGHTHPSSGSHHNWGVPRYVTQRTFLDGYEHYAGHTPWPQPSPVPAMVPSQPAPVPTSEY